ncbi:MAG: cell division protein ZapE [Burkholderiaceae bacterium]|jgi:cell division protein ZapE
MSVIHCYKEALKSRGFDSDSAQLRAVVRLQAFQNDLMRFNAARSNLLKKILIRPAVPRGVYLWGGVGRGKSFLMDCFYQAVPVTRKVRLHFHEFMRGVHSELDELRHEADPLDEVARRVARRYRLICFDEFHVSDIADAMILYRLLQALFALGVTFIFTSNYHPDELYPNGLHRDRIYPAIALMKNRLDVLNVDGGADYRRLGLAGLSTYLMPLDDASDASLKSAFERLAEVTDEPAVLQIESRRIPAVRRAGGLIWFDFPTLCGGPRSQNDYLEIAEQFHTVILSGVPMMGAGMASEARRFTWLIDVLYDHKIKLLISADVAADALYTDGAMAHEFARTVSRIVEMQSQAYMEAPRRLGGAWK